MKAHVLAMAVAVTGLFTGQVYAESTATLTQRLTLHKTCNAEFKALVSDESSVTMIQIYEDKATKALTAEIQSNDTDSAPTKVIESAISVQSSVRAGLTVQTAANDLNGAEKLVVQMMGFAANSKLEKWVQVPFDLTAVRSVRVFKIGSSGSEPLASLVEARDEKGQIIGSVVQSLFAIAPCL